MGTVYILGAGFSKTCGIATDLEMLDTLNPFLKREIPEGGGTSRTTIEHCREQNFRGQKEVSFELFMSTLSALKFLPDALGLHGGKNVFRSGERELRRVLTDYLTGCVSKVDWNGNGKTILDFVRTVDWQHDHILTFNYDLLLEAAVKKSGNVAEGRIIHLHGAIAEEQLAWPIYTKFAYRTTKTPLAPRWKEAFLILRDQIQLDRVIFIGYSMPPSDFEARGLFNYVDWYNSLPDTPFVRGELVPVAKRYTYPIVVVNPSPTVKPNYAFFRRTPKFIPLTLEGWLRNG